MTEHKKQNLNKHTKRNLYLTCKNVTTAHTCVCVCVCVTLCTTVVHNTARSSSDYLASYPPDKHHSSDAVYWRGGDDSSGYKEPRTRWWSRSLKGRGIFEGVTRQWCGVLIVLCGSEFSSIGSVSVRFWIKTSVSVLISKPSQHYF